MITGTCAHCHTELALRPTGLHMTVYDNGIGYYEFFCAKCFEHNTFPLNEATAYVLDKAGVKASLVHVPLEVAERESTDERITVDDLLALHVEMDETDYLLG